MDSMYDILEMDDGSYSIMELSTHAVVASGLMLYEANVLRDKLNNGSGFNGNTPRFLTEENT